MNVCAKINDAYLYMHSCVYFGHYGFGRVISKLLPHLQIYLQHFYHETSCISFIHFIHLAHVTVVVHGYISALA